MQNDKVPGKNQAIASLVLGIVAVILWFPSIVGAWAIVAPVVSVVLGIVGLVLAGHAKRAGFTGSVRTAGFVLSLIGLIGGLIVFVACLSCIGTIGLIALQGSDSVTDVEQVVA